MAKANLFGKAKKKVTPVAKKDDKTVVTIKGEEFSTNLARFNQLKKDIANQTAELKSLEGDIKSNGVDSFMKLYTDGKRNPGSFKLASEKDDKVMVIIMDRYLKVDEDRAEELTETWGEDIVTEDTTYSFNGSLLDKYQEKISEMIMKAKFMTDDEKSELIVASTAFAIKKGAINEAMTLGKGEIEDFLGEIQPVVQLKQTR